MRANRDAAALPLNALCGQAIQWARRRQLLTQAELAKRMNDQGLPMTQPGISSIESGHNLTLVVLTALGVALNCSPLTFILGDDLGASVDLGGGKTCGANDLAAWWLGDEPLSLIEGGRYTYFAVEEDSEEADWRYKSAYRRNRSLVLERMRAVPIREAARNKE